jgi:hypothetical protein
LIYFPTILPSRMTADRSIVFTNEFSTPTPL